MSRKYGQKKCFFLFLLQKHQNFYAIFYYYILYIELSNIVRRFIMIVLRKDAILVYLLKKLLSNFLLSFKVNTKENCKNTDVYLY